MLPTYRQQDIENQHFKLPFQFGNNGAGSALCNEQGSTDDVVDCIKMILAYPIGVREDIPSFGCPELLFRQLNTVESVSRLHSAILRWETRADIDLHLRSVLADPEVQQFVMKVRGVVPQ